MGWRLRGNVALGLLALAVLAPNAGVIHDALAYRRPVAQVRALLPAEWQDFARGEPEAVIQALEAAMSQAQRAEAAAAGVVARVDVGGRPVLAVPIGLDSDMLDLTTGCFRFARRQVMIFVWHFDISIACL